MFFFHSLSLPLPLLSYTRAGILCFLYKPCQFNYRLTFGTCARVTAAVLCVCVSVSVCVCPSVTTQAAIQMHASLIPRPHELEHMHHTPTATE